MSPLRVSILPSLYESPSIHNECVPFFTEGVLKDKNFLLEILCFSDSEFIKGSSSLISGSKWVPHGVKSAEARC